MLSLVRVHRVFLALLLSLACTGGAAAQSTHILRLPPTPEEDVWRLQTRIRHTTVITLPASETILDFVVGDGEYWHLSGAANVAFLKPIEEDVETNIALVCESGRIWSFLVAESADLDPHLVVRFTAPDREAAGEGLAAPAGSGAHQPAFVARSRVLGFQNMAQQAQADAEQAHTVAENRIQEARDAAAAEIDIFRAAYPLRIEFPYTLDKKARRWPFMVEAMWHDGQFTYLRSRAQESPALYERKDGKPSLIPYDLTATGLYVVRRIVGEGWLQIGNERAPWRFTPPDPLP